jgi:ketopantoate reductase
MLQDLLAHKELERESIVDTLVELGEVTGVQTPLLGAMAGLLTALDATSRGLPFGELH